MSEASQGAQTIPVKCLVVVLDILTHLGMPLDVVGMLRVAWSAQRRHLVYLHQIHPRLVSVSSSLLQGDSWSMVCMSAYLLAPVRDIARNHPQVDQILYADDRTLTAPTTTELRAATTAWTTWGRELGLKDNEEKRQYFHPTVPGRRALQEEGFQPEQIKADVNVLGYCLQGVSARKALAMEAKRLEAAVATAMRIRCLPGGLNRRAYQRGLWLALQKPQQG